MRFNRWVGHSGQDFRVRARNHWPAGRNQWQILLRFLEILDLPDHQIGEAGDRITKLGDLAFEPLQAIRVFVAVSDARPLCDRAAKPDSTKIGEVVAMQSLLGEQSKRRCWMDSSIRHFVSR